MSSSKKSDLNFNQTIFLLGNPVEHSLSPAMQNAAFQYLRLHWVYAPLAVDPQQIGQVIGILRSSNVRGANVTIPFKEAVISHLDQVDDHAVWLGSVNTIYRKDEKIYGTSTDGEGFLRSLGSLRRSLKGSTGILLGAGGAAKAVAGALAGSEVNKFFIANRSSQRSKELAKIVKNRYPQLEINVISFKESEKLLPRVDWVIQATSLGLNPDDPSPISLKNASSQTWVVELIYNRSTVFLTGAIKKRLRSVGGLGMLLHQGALAFEKWTGRPAPLKIMQKVLIQNLT
jgi:shikimate dehydrogenase